MIFKTKKLLECIVFRPNSASDEKPYYPLFSKVGRKTICFLLGCNFGAKAYRDSDRGKISQFDFFFIRILRKQFFVRNLKKMCRGVYRPIYLAVRQKFEKNIAVVFCPTFDKRGSWSFTSEV